MCSALRRSRSLAEGDENDSQWNACEDNSRYKSEMRVLWVTLATIAVAGVLGAMPARAANATPTASPMVSSPFRSFIGADEKSGRSRNAGTIEGVVTGVDYRRGIITLQSPGRGKLDFVVLPSTTFEGRNNSDFQAFSDVVRGEKVEILASQRADILIAQVVRLK